MNYNIRTILTVVLLIRMVQVMAGDAEAKPKTYLALGDSYTIGESAAESERYPVQLAKMLNKDGIAVADPQIIARTGWTTDELDAAIDRAAPKGPYDLVTLLIGVNNQFRGRSEEEYKKQFDGLLKRAIGFAGNDAGRVIVFSIPDWVVTPFAKRFDGAKVGKEIDRFNAVAKELTEKAGCKFIDITPISRKAPSDTSLIARDGLHPSGAMYTEWSKAALETAKSVLARK
jgi:lysophospholipase L1-like esterase